MIPQRLVSPKGEQELQVQLMEPQPLEVEEVRQQEILQDVYQEIFNQEVLVVEEQVEKIQHLQQQEQPILVVAVAVEVIQVTQVWEEEVE
jgi:hypothetical protein